MEHLKKKLDGLMKKAITDEIFPGAAVGISHGCGAKRKFFRCAYGHASLSPQKKFLTPPFFFDLASLTKPLATTVATLCLMKQEKISLQTKLSRLFSEGILPIDKKDITICHLLGHTSGLPAYRPYFKELINYYKLYFCN